MKDAAGSSRPDDANSAIYIDDKDLNRANSSEVQEQSQEEANADEKRIAELSKLSEDHQERLQVLSEVFEKASKNDRIVEVRHSTSKNFL